MSKPAWWTRTHGWWWWTLAALAVAFPLARLWPLDGQFVLDWFNHKWLSAYTGQYLRVHGAFPAVINTAGQAGMPYPIFYGTLYYPLTGLFTAWLSPDLVIRVVVLGVTALQFHLVSRALVRMSVRHWPARGVACLTIWAIYPLTNLYNRSAITEYVAVALLTSAVATWFLLINAERAADRNRLGFGFGLLLALTAGTHPITALYSLPILLLLVVAAAAEHRTSRSFWFGLVRALVAPAALVIVVLLPWLYVVRMYRDYVQVNHTWTPWFYAGIDELTTRLAPIPYDPRTVGVALESVEHPYIDAQLNGPLLLLLLGAVAIFAWRSQRRAIASVKAVAVGLVALCFFLWISVSPSSYDVLPVFVRMIQIAYRAVSYQNLSLLLAAFMHVGTLRRHESASVPPRPKLVGGLLVICLLMAALGVVVKWTHGTAAMKQEGPGTVLADADTRAHWAQLPPQFYGLYGYATPALFEPMPNVDEVVWTQIWVPIGERSNFGRPERAEVTLATETWVGTNLQAFAWNAVYVDGHRVRRDQLRVESGRLVAKVPAGTHVLTLRTHPDRTWVALRRVSLAVFALWLVAFIVLVIREHRRTTRSALPNLE